MVKTKNNPKVYKKEPPITELSITTPYYLVSTRKTMADKKFPMSLNTFYGARPDKIYRLKTLFHKHMEAQLSHVVLQTPVEITCRVYTPTRARSDKSNWFGASSKALYDSMTRYGVWEDDNDSFLKTEVLLPSIYDKGNERIEWTFTTVPTED